MFREWNLSEEAARHIKGAEDMRAAWGMLDAVYDGAPAQRLGATRAPELLRVERAEREALGTLGANAAELGVGTGIGLRGGHIFINTPHGIRRLKCLWASGEDQEHTVVSFEAARRYSLRIGSRKRAVRVVGPTGATVDLHTSYEIFLLLDDLPGRTKRAVAHGVKSVGEFCGLADGAMTMIFSWEGISWSSYDSCEGSSRTEQEPPCRNGGERRSGGFPCRPRPES
jgi:hypothetical protein